MGFWVKQGGRILVVDDERLNILVLRGILAHANLEVLSASDGAEALAMANEHSPDLILLDVMMPGENGFDICMKLKQHGPTSHIPVIIVTCLTDVSNKLTGLNLGAVDYITKPFHALEVVARVRSHLNSRRRQGDLIKAQADRLGQLQAAQQAMLVRPESLPGACFDVHFMPVLEAGGDFYDVVDLGQGQAGYFLADVSGHDLGACFITSSLKALFRQHAAPATPAAETLAAMNTILHAIMPEEQYLTALYLRIDRAAGRFDLASAGHPAALAQRSGQADFLDLSGSPLGMFPEVELESAQGEVAPGAGFLLYTDGLVARLGAHVVTEPLFRSAMRELLAGAAEGAAAGPCALGKVVRAIAAKCAAKCAANSPGVCDVHCTAKYADMCAARCGDMCAAFASAPGIAKGDIAAPGGNAASMGRAPGPCDDVLVMEVVV